MPRRKNLDDLHYGDYVLPAGRHQGKSLRQLLGRSIHYLTWIVGYKRESRGEFAKLENSAVEVLGTRKQHRANEKPKCFHCLFVDQGESPDKLWPECLMDSVGETPEETLQLLNQHLHHKIVRHYVGLYTAWRKLSLAEPEMVDTVNLFLDLNHICWECGKQLGAEDCGKFHTKCMS